MGWVALAVLVPLWAAVAGVKLPLDLVADGLKRAIRAVRRWSRRPWP